MQHSDARKKEIGNRIWRRPRHLKSYLHMSISFCDSTAFYGYSWERASYLLQYFHRHLTYVYWFFIFKRAFSYFFRNEASHMYQKRPINTMYVMYVMPSSLFEQRRTREGEARPVEDLTNRYIHTYIWHEMSAWSGKCADNWPNVKVSNAKKWVAAFRRISFNNAFALIALQMHLVLKY
jgi:hypothetical protein